MTCEQVRELLEAHADDGLEPEVARDVDRHVTSCGACSARLERVRRLLEAARHLPRSIQPPRDLWPEIQGRIEGRTVLPLPARGAARGFRLPAWFLAAAAVTLIALSSGITALLMNRAAPTGGAEPAALPIGLSELERDYQDAAREIERVLATQRAAMPPEGVAALERSRRVIDEAIREARTALASNPENTDLPRLLWATYQQKLDLLRRATRLTGES